MNCWHCQTALIWGNDHTDADDDTRIITFLSCPNCPTHVEVYYNTQGLLNPLLNPFVKDQYEEEKVEIPTPTLVVPVRTN